MDYLSKCPEETIWATSNALCLHVGLDRYSYFELLLPKVEFENHFWLHLLGELQTAIQKSRSELLCKAICPSSLCKLDEDAAPWLACALSRLHLFRFPHHSLKDENANSLDDVQKYLEEFLAMKPLQSWEAGIFGLKDRWGASVALSGLYLLG